MTDNTTLWWFVALIKNDKLYYVADADSDEGAVMWCPDREQAVKFVSEKAVGEFVTKVLHGRSDVHLVHSAVGN